MEKTRVPKGEKYWFINENFDSEYDYEQYVIYDDGRFDLGNYFATEIEVNAMVTKLRAVLKGAEVIEMPSKSDIVTERDLRMKACDVYGEFEPAFQDGFYECYEYLKSKIVK